MHALCFIIIIRIIIKNSASWGFVGNPLTVGFALQDHSGVTLISFGIKATVPFRFYARQHRPPYAIASIYHGNFVRLSVCLSICLSHLRTALKRLNILGLSKFFHYLGNVIDRGIVTTEDDYKVVLYLLNIHRQDQNYYIVICNVIPHCLFTDR